MGGEDEGQLPPRPPRRGLSAEELEALLAWLDTDRTKAGEIYVALRRKLARFFERSRFKDAEELADETLNRVARWLLAEGAPGAEDRYSFCHGFARRIRQERWRRIDREQASLEKEPAAPPREPDAEDEEERRVLLEALRDCLARLPGDEQSLILRYYDGENRIQSRRELAAQRGVTLNALRIQAFRVRRRVEACLQGGGNVFPPRDI
jgi:DNA-directed RNA polymerase specialized sigma24 family protein